MTPGLVNGSPRLPRIPLPSALDHQSFDITLHRKDTEGFGFVILTSKSKPPYGGTEPLTSARPPPCSCSGCWFLTCIAGYNYE